jgi:hypothetical protein
VADVATFRDEYRRQELGPSYSGWGHFAFTSIGSLAAIAFAASRVTAMRGWEWAVIPATLLFANLAEYFGHKGPMHHLRPGLRLIFHRHTQQHHRFFTADQMECTRTSDFKMILFPPVMLLFFLGGIATPAGLAVYFLVSPNAGWLFAACAVGYFLLYEWLHFAYHQPPRGIWRHLPGLARLRRHHQLHHDPHRMDRNFNLTFPIADWLFGTMDDGSKSRDS